MASAQLAKLADLTSRIAQSGKNFDPAVYSTKLKRWMYLYPHMSVGVFLGTLGLVVPIATYLYDPTKESDSLGHSGRLQYWQKRAPADSAAWKAQLLASIDHIKDEKRRAQVVEILNTHERFNSHQ